MLTQQFLDTILTRRVAEVIGGENIIAKLKSGKQLRIKYGIDPTATSFHLGHTIPLRKLNEFQKLGHIGVFIIGDFTAQIGDPVGKSDTRKMLTLKQTQDNAKKYVEFASKFIDLKKTEIHFQSEWYKKITLEETIRLMATVTKEQLMRHETFRSRERDGKPLGFHEMFYTLMMAFDSVMVKPDVELGGTDQKFNFLMTRQVMEKFDLVPEDAILMKFLPGTDGVEKMSKSGNNFVGMDESPTVQFDKIMKIPDENIVDFFDLATDISTREVKNFVDRISLKLLHPVAAKRALSLSIVSDCHGKKTAQLVDQKFLKSHPQLRKIIK